MIETQEKKKRGRPAGSGKTISDNIPYNASLTVRTRQMKDISFDPKIFIPLKTDSGLLDEFISSTGGFLPATNLICIGDPGIGKSTVMLDLLIRVKEKNPEARILFISGEMSSIDMVGYCRRYPKMLNLDILFMEDYLEENPRQVLEQTLGQGWDLVLIDSWAEVTDGVREFYNWDRRKTESWMLDLLRKHNKGENELGKYTCFIPIQQVTKGGEFVGSNKLKHMTTGMIELRLDKPTGIRFMYFSKNRRGTVGEKLSFILQNDAVQYTKINYVVGEDDYEE